jgi:hypothetical protein
MGLVDDPISGLLGVFFKRALDSKIMQYGVLVLELVIAGTITFLATTGGALMAQSSVAWAIGAGMVATAIVMLATFQSSPNSKGLTISIQQKVVEEKLDTPTSTISRK